MGKDSEKIKQEISIFWGGNMKTYCDWNVKKYYDIVLVILLFYYCIKLNRLELVGVVSMILIIKRKIWGRKVWLFPHQSILYIKHTVSAIWLHTSLYSISVYTNPVNLYGECTNRVLCITQRKKKSNLLFLMYIKKTFFVLGLMFIALFFLIW